MGDGRKTAAPCGHPGEVIVGQYVKCLEGCDDDLEFDISDGTVDFELLDDDMATKPLCAHCGGSDVEIWPGLYANGSTLMYCNGCGKAFPG